MQKTNNGTIYIDCTNTVFTGLNTGIQRVVRNVIQRLPSDIEAERPKFVPVVAVMGGFYKFNADISKKLVWTKLLSLILSTTRNLLNNIFMNKHSNGDWPVDVINTKPDVSDIHGNIVFFIRKLLPVAFQFAYRADGIITGKKINIKDNDVLFLSDAFWVKSLMEAICNINNSNFKLIILIYDIFAISHSDCVDNIIRTNYINCLNELMCKIDGVISISKSSLSDIQAYISNKKSGVIFDYFYLGANFSFKGKISGNVRSELISLFDSDSTFLAVGTIEPRKNYGYLLDAFQQLWQQEPHINLCIVGRVGWKCEELMERVGNSQSFGERLFHFTDLNDDELEYCYNKSKAVIFPSIAEGFGLPLVEAMHYGKPVFASDILVFREVGKDYPIYFDLNDCRSLSFLIQNFENCQLTKKFEPQKCLSWDESIDDLFKKLVDMTVNIT